MTAESTVQFSKSEMRRYGTTVWTRRRPGNGVQAPQDRPLLVLGQVVAEPASAVAGQRGEKSIRIGQQSGPIST